MASERDGFVDAPEILARAAELVASPLPHEWAACRFNLGDYCPRCACARSASDLYTRAGSTDAGLRDAIGLINQKAGSVALSRDEALAVIRWAQGVFA